MTHATYNACCHDVCDQTEADTMGVVLKKRLFALLDWVKQAFSVSRQRRELVRMSDQQLHDIGVTRDDAEREANRPFWDLP